MEDQEKVQFNISDICFHGDAPTQRLSLPDPEQIRMKVEQDMLYWKYMAEKEESERRHYNRTLLVLTLGCLAFMLLLAILGYLFTVTLTEP